MQLLSLMYRIFNFVMYSFVIKIGIPVNKAVLLETLIPAPGLIKPVAELPTADPYPIKISVKNRRIFFFFRFLCFFYKIHYQFQVI